MNWFKKSQINNPKELQEIINKWRNQGITLYVFERENVIILDSIIIPKDMRKQGLGTQIINELSQYADSVNKRIELTTGTKDSYQGTTSQNRLKRFYKRLNFVENKGRNKDFRTRNNMYREPENKE
ncbi:MAG: GNAT family N-acetyltransferase [bacterium]